MQDAAPDLFSTLPGLPPAKASQPGGGRPGDPLVLPVPCEPAPAAAAARPRHLNTERSGGGTGDCVGEGRRRRGGCTPW